MPNFMSASDYGDASCARCGAPVYFNVGPGPQACGACGGDWSRTEEQEAQERAENEARDRAMATPEYWIADMERKLDAEICGLELMYTDGLVPLPAKAVRKARELIEDLQEAKRNLRR